MARNIRNISVKAYNVDYAVAQDGKLEQANSYFETNSPRKLTKAIAAAHNCDPANVVIINTEEVSTEYRITDIVTAMAKLQELGLARPVTAADTEEPKQTAKQASKK